METITLNKEQMSYVADCIIIAIDQNAKARELTTGIGAKHEIQNEISRLQQLLKIFTQQ